MTSGQESGIDMAFDVTELIEMNEENFNMEFGMIKSQPIVGR